MYDYLAIGLHGIHVYDTCIPDNRPWLYWYALKNYGLFIDKTAVLKVNPGLAFKSPICNKAFPGKEKPWYACGPLDYIGPQGYSLWWKCHGASIGVRILDEMIIEQRVYRVMPPSRMACGYHTKLASLLLKNH